MFLKLDLREKCINDALPYFNFTLKGANHEKKKKKNQTFPFKIKNANF